MSIHFGKEVKVGKGIIYPTNIHGVPMEPGYMKIQVDTVYPGWEGFKVPMPTDEVTLLGDATKDARFIQWPKDYLKVHMSNYYLLIFVLCLLFFSAAVWFIYVVIAVFFAIYAGFLLLLFGLFMLPLLLFLCCLFC